MVINNLLFHIFINYLSSTFQLVEVFFEGFVNTPGKECRFEIVNGKHETNNEGMIKKTNRFFYMNPSKICLEIKM